MTSSFLFAQWIPGKPLELTCHVVFRVSNWLPQTHRNTEILWLQQVVPNGLGTWNRRLKLLNFEPPIFSASHTHVLPGMRAPCRSVEKSNDLFQGLATSPQASDRGCAKDHNLLYSLFKTNPQFVGEAAIGDRSFVVLRFFFFSFFFGGGRRNEHK